MLFVAKLTEACLPRFASAHISCRRAVSGPVVVSPGVIIFKSLLFERCLHQQCTGRFEVAAAIKHSQVGQCVVILAVNSGVSPLGHNSEFPADF